MHDDNAGSRAAPLPSALPPKPDPAFRWNRETWGYALRCLPLEGIAQHLFTSRQRPLPPSDPGTQPADACAIAAASFGGSPPLVMRVRQVHGCAVRVVRAPEAGETAAAERPDGDAVVSDAHGLLLAVVVADCVPVLIADGRAGAAAAVHAGWRGTCAGVVPAAVAALARDCGARPDDMVAAIGPSIGPADYEVGDALLSEFAAAGHGAVEAARWFRRVGSDLRLVLDLWQATRDQLEAAGIPPSAIYSCGLSTARHPDWLESFRRDGSHAGRLAALVRVPARGAAGT